MTLNKLFRRVFSLRERRTSLCSEMVSLSKQIVISGYLLSFTVHSGLVRHFFLKRTHLIIITFFSLSFRFFMVLKTLTVMELNSNCCREPSMSFKALYGHFPEVIPPRILGPLFWNEQYYM